MKVIVNGFFAHGEVEVIRALNKVRPGMNFIVVDDRAILEAYLPILKASQHSFMVIAPEGEASSGTAEFEGGGNVQVITADVGHLFEIPTEQGAERKIHVSMGTRGGTGKTTLSLVLMGMALQNPAYNGVVVVDADPNGTLSTALQVMGVSSGKRIEIREVSLFKGSSQKLWLCLHPRFGLDREHETMFQTALDNLRLAMFFSNYPVIVDTIGNTTLIQPFLYQLSELIRVERDLAFRPKKLSVRFLLTMFPQKPDVENAVELIKTLNYQASQLGSDVEFRFGIVYHFLSDDRSIQMADEIFAKTQELKEIPRIKAPNLRLPMWNYYESMRGSLSDVVDLYRKSFARADSKFLLP